MAEGERILVVKLSALGDVVMAVAAFQAIRRHHPEARIVLLTTAPYRELAEASGCFDEVWLDRRPRWWDAPAWIALRRRLRAGGFRRVYDLQRSERSAWYFRMLGPRRPEWVGTVPGCSHRYRMPRGEARHIAEREAEQLALAGVPAPDLPDLSFLDADMTRFGLPGRMALLVPGGAAHRPDKRWPRERFAALAGRLVEAGLTPVLLGAAAEAEALGAIAAACPAARNLCGRTSLADLAALARRAELAVGNDTGPMHVIAAAGCPSLVLYSRHSEPAKVAPRGPSVAVLQRPELSVLGVDEVWAALPAPARSVRSELEAD